LTLLAGCADPCGDEVVETKVASDRSKTAVLFQRNCGATTGFNMQVSILESGQKLEGAGNVFIADGDHGAASGELRIVELAWVRPDHLLISHHPRARIFKSDGQLSGVRITYVAQPILGDAS
jgi:hypothetical protein